MQHAPHRDGQRAGHALRIILLQSRDGLGDFDGVVAVDRSAIIAKAREITLQCGDIGRRRNQFAAALKIIERSPGMARRKIRVVDSRPALMEQAPVIPRREMGRPEEIASVALFLASDDSSYVNGMELVVDGGTTVI